MSLEIAILIIALVLLIVVICAVFVIFYFYKKFERKDTSDFSSFNNDINQTMKNDINQAMKGVQASLENLSRSIGSFDEIKNNVVKNNQDMLKGVKELSDALSYSGPLGRFGERSLTYILSSVFGSNPNIYKLQYTFRNNSGEPVRADAVIFLPEPLKMLCIDSKFSFVKYQNLIQQKDSSSYKEFRLALRQEIDKIKNSYIVSNQTINYVLMFVPSDSIYFYLEGDETLYSDVIEYGYKNNVVIVSPSSIVPILRNILLFVEKLNLQNNAKSVVEYSKNVLDALNNFKDSWNSFYQEIERLEQKANDFNAKVNTVIKKVEKLNKVNLGDEDGTR